MMSFYDNSNSQSEKNTFSTHRSKYRHWSYGHITSGTDEKTWMRNKQAYVSAYMKNPTPRIPVSRFNSFYETSPTSYVDLDFWLLTDQFRHNVEQIRKYTDLAKKQYKKSHLPCITPSGLFNKRSGTGLIRHSGMICIDIDRKDNPEVRSWSKVKWDINTIPGLHYAGLSVSGNGLFAIIKIAHSERHLEHFWALEKDFRELGLVVDTACKDVCRLRCASYDPKPVFYLEENVEPYEKLILPDNKNHGVGQRQFLPQTRYRVEYLISRIETLHLDITDAYRDWFSIGCALCSEFGESGREYFHRISCQSPKYDQNECDATYNKCARYTRVQIATFFHLCAKHNLIFKKHEE